MKEKVVTFRNSGCMVGIVTEPAAELHMTNMPAVLFWNAGLLHRVGPNRLYVDLARRLASQGYFVTRFDLSGRGDSETRKDRLSHEERTVSDIQEVMNFLITQKGIQEFVLIGFCSGASDAHRVAALDERVSGGVFLDGFTYPTWGFYLRDYGPGLLKPQKWLPYIKRKFQNADGNSSENDQNTGSQRLILNLKPPPKKNVKADLAMLAGRGMNLLYIYSGGIPGFYNYREQFTDAFRGVDFRDKLELEYFKEADHIYTKLEDREKLMNRICEWMQQHYEKRCASSN